MRKLCKENEAVCAEILLDTLVQNMELVDTSTQKCVDVAYINLTERALIFQLEL